MISSVKNIFNNYYSIYKKIPPRFLFREYVSLYISSKDELSNCEKELIERTGFSNFVIEQINKSKIKKFDNYDEMIYYLKNSLKKVKNENELFNKKFNYICYK